MHGGVMYFMLVVILCHVILRVLNWLVPAKVSVNSFQPFVMVKSKL